MIKGFYVNNINSYPHDENLYLFKRDLIKKDLRSRFPDYYYSNSAINKIMVKCM